MRESGTKEGVELSDLSIFSKRGWKSDTRAYTTWQGLKQHLTKGDSLRPTKKLAIGRYRMYALRDENGNITSVDDNESR